MDKKKVIWKYPVSPQFDVELPEDAEVLSVQAQDGKPQMWVLLDPDAPKVKRTFLAVHRRSVRYHIHELHRHIST